MHNDIINKIEEKMNHTITNLISRLVTIRAGRANASLVDGVMVSSYGSMLPLNQVATVTVSDARSLTIRPYDRQALAAIEKAIFEADLGLTPNNNGETVFITIPPLTEERRKEFVKLAKGMAEEAKIALRNIRQDGNTMVKNLEESEDIKKALTEDIQNLINKYNNTIDTKLEEKEKELLTV